MKLLLSFILVFNVISINAQKTKEKKIILDPYLSFQNYEHFKRLTLSSPNSPIEYLDGFVFEWGYTYIISVIETQLKEWLSDGTRFTYFFTKIISKTKVPDSSLFKLYLDPKKYYSRITAR